MKIIKKTIFFLILSCFFLTTNPVNAKPISDTSDMFSAGEDFRIAAGFVRTTGGAGTVGGTAKTIISAFLSLLAIIFVILIIIAGYNWMTAAGEEAKVTYAKETIKRAVIGLIIIAAAYAITAFIFQSITMGSGAGTMDGM